MKCVIAAGRQNQLPGKTCETYLATNCDFVRIDRDRYLTTTGLHLGQCMEGPRKLLAVILLFMFLVKLATVFVSHVASPVGINQPFLYITFLYTDVGSGIICPAVIGL